MSETVRERIRAQEARLTRAERQIAGAIEANYPVSGLVSITRLAEAAAVSTPSVARMVQKLGFKGFGAFQDALRDELEARISTPIAKQDRWAGAAPADHILNRFTEAATANIQRTVAGLEAARIDAAAALLADEARAVRVAGGRITGSLADHFRRHMEVVRPRVALLRAGGWAHALLDMGAGDVLVVYDIRRYETDTLRLAGMAAGRGAEIVLVTDQWRSPVERHARVVLPCRIEAPSAWDSVVTLTLVTEILIAAAQERRRDGARARMAALEEILDESRTFRKFV